jgi:hypothetical protein
MPVFIGSIDKLGALPVLAAIAIQVKDASWPLQISWWQIVLFGLLAFFYWMSVLLLDVCAAGQFAIAGGALRRIAEKGTGAARNLTGSVHVFEQ